MAWLVRDRFRLGAVGLVLFVSAAAGAPTSTATFVTSTTPAVRINEILAANPNNRHGTTADLIELHNAGAVAVDLSNRSLTDDPALPRKFVFPAGTTIAAGGYLVLYAEAAASTPPQLRTGFSLDAEGDQVLLFDANASTPSDSIRFGFQVPDQSIARTGAAANVWALTPPTFGGANGSAVALGAPGGLKLNEWAGNIVFRLDHDMIELFNPASQPVAITGVRLTDDITPGRGYVFPALSHIAANGFLPLYKGDYLFGLNGDRATVTLLGENNERIDQITLIAQLDDRSAGRSPDASANLVTFDIPSPGISNQTPFPAAYHDLLRNLRITELMYDPAANSNASQFEFVELQNIGAAPLDLGGVRITNGIDYTFPGGTTLAPGAFVVVANDRSSFRSRYPQVPDTALAPGAFNGSLANDGETIALTLPAPWRVHILRFRYESSWYPAASRGGYSVVPVAPATAAPAAWQARSGWRTSAAVNGSPAAADPGTPGAVTARLSNLSVRTSLGADQTLIVGVVVSGGPRDILVRAAGPALAAFNLDNPMADPRLDVYRGDTFEAANDDWDPSLATTFASVGAFAFARGSRDAAILRGIDGPRSIWARGTGAGRVLVEAYDTGSELSPRLINVSARNRVGTGDDILIAGFTVAGTGTKGLLIRGIGPKLAAFGVPGALADPVLEVFAGATRIADNDNWNPTLAATFVAVGAFALDPNSLDAALMIPLAPGSYTVQVRGANNGTGEGLVEIYELP